MTNQPTLSELVLVRTAAWRVRQAAVDTLRAAAEAERDVAWKAYSEANARAWDATDACLAALEKERQQ